MRACSVAHRSFRLVSSICGSYLNCAIRRNPSQTPSKSPIPSTPIHHPNINININSNMSQTTAATQEQPQSQPMRFTRVLLRNPGLALERPALLTAAIGEVIPFLLLLINFTSWLTDGEISARPGNTALCMVILIMHEFTIDRERLARWADEQRARRDA